MKALRRFVAVGSAATVLDVVVLVVLAQVVGWPPVLADVVAVVAATAFSVLGHRVFTFSNDPGRRWFSDRQRYLTTAVAALFVDVGVFVALTRAPGSISTIWLLVAKVISLLLAFLLRSFAFRRAMFTAVRADQTAPRQRPPAPGEVRLSLVIPAYFEEDGIGVSIARVEADLGHLRDDGGFEIVVVDDGSTDDTAGAARRAGADQVVRLEQNSGKGAAVRAGVLAAGGRTIAGARIAGTGRGRVGRGRRQSSAHRGPCAGCGPPPS
jgi:putative flippase GtrA